MNKSILKYTNINVIKRYAKDFNKSEQFAIEVFSDFLKWLYVVNILKKDGIMVPMTRSLNELDNMWHTFLLFTRDYSEFCHQYFGKFVHHRPFVDGQEKDDEEKRRNYFKKYLDLLVEEFGEGLVLHWYKELVYAKNKSISN